MTREPLTVYECPECGQARTLSVDSVKLGVTRASCTSGHQAVLMRPVRVFREEDVRPLYAAGQEVVIDCESPAGLSIARARTRAALDAFPAPEEWRS